MSHIIEIISERERKESLEYERSFQLIDGYSGSGYGFPCDEQGNLCMDDEFVDFWYKNYEYCLAHPEKYEDRGVVKNSWEYTEPTHAMCSCGNEIILNGDCMCEKCGQWYNAFGQALKDPCHWYDEEDFYDEY